MLNLCEKPSHLGHEAICLVCQRDDSLKRPNVFGQISGHRWSHRQRTVDSSEIVMHRVDCDIWSLEELMGLLETKAVEAAP